MPAPATPFLLARTQATPRRLRTEQHDCAAGSSGARRRLVRNLLR